MTSVKRQDGNYYGSDKEPAYNILSYTWGRFQTSRGDPAYGVPWPVPGIDGKHFSRTGFHKAVSTVVFDEGAVGPYAVSPTISYVWVDVACINQEDDVSKAIEIGNQAAIFRNASSAHVWLSRLDEIEIRTCNDFLAHSLTMLTTLSEDEGSESVLHESWAEQYVHHLQTLLGDPWFTSLWTLQEMFLRSEAYILSKNSEPIERPKALWGLGRFLTLGDLIRSCSSIYDALTRRVHVMGRGLSPGLTKVMDLIERLGLYSRIWVNPMLLFSAAKHRETREPRDRVYGIMQVYDFKLGASAHPDRVFSLDDLEFQLAAAHNTRSPLLAQLFVHSKAIELGKCWRMDSGSQLPDVLRVIKTEREIACDFSLKEGHLPTLTGNACHLKDIVDVWREASVGTTRLPSNRRSNAIQSISLDVTEFSLESLPDHLQNLHFEDDTEQHELGALIVDVFGDSARVIQLGELTDGIDDDADLFAGLIICQRHLGSTVCWQRQGICLSEKMEDTLADGLDESFYPFEGLLG